MQRFFETIKLEAGKWYWYGTVLCFMRRRARGKAWMDCKGPYISETEWTKEDCREEVVLVQYIDCTTPLNTVYGFLGCLC